jgi:hypothetical protein
MTEIVRGFQSPVQKEADLEQRPPTKPEDKPDQAPRIIEIFETAVKASEPNDISKDP